VVGVIAFLAIVFVRWANMNLLGYASKGKDKQMTKTTNNQSKLFIYSVLESIWAIGVDAAASALPA
jgi:hypothetical protein